MNQLKDFEEMKVWQDAQDLAVNIYEDFANIRDFSFGDQIKRAGISISNNIAEGSERNTRADFSRFLDIAKGSTGEVRSMYLLGERLKLVDQARLQERRAACLEISKQLAGFAKYLRSK
ncbi:MAG: four helix bundle protein [Verrucomicrobiota bacterium]